MQRILQQYPEQADSARRAVNYAVESLVNQQWEQSRVVQVGMRQDHGINSGRPEPEFLLAQALDGVTSLVHAAVEQQLHAFVLHQVTRPCYLSGRPQKNQ